MSSKPNRNEITEFQATSTKAETEEASVGNAARDEKIRFRAYEIYLERNGAPGNPLEDWVRAEREILAKSRKTTKKTAAVAA